MTISVRLQQQRLERRLFGSADEVRVGRYVLGRVLGQGGMATVYAAHDAQLERRIAIKVLHRAYGDAISANARLIREARTMARLAHPNIVEVFEVGTQDGQVFVAMELCQGTSMATWIGERHDVATICAAFIQAGRGLAAAHAAGIVHRDFKPANVLIDREGRVRVTDFGLAGQLHGPPASSPGLSSKPGSDDGGSLTVTGATVGTPAYMSPEQHRGVAATARSDQWSFCVSLYEALYRHRPFEGESLLALRSAIDDAAPPRRARASGVPRWLDAIVRRGLRHDPAERFASMDELVDALRRGVRSGRRRRSIVLATGGLVGAAGLGLAMVEAPGAPPCEEAAARLHGVWDDTRRAEIGAALGEVGKNGADTAMRVSSNLDGYAQDWIAARVETCRSHEAADEPDEAHFDAATRCLERGRMALVALVEVLQEPTKAIAASAVVASMGLPRIDRCTDAEIGDDEVAPPSDPELASEVAAVREALARIEARSAVGDFSRARTLSERALLHAQRLAYRPLLAEALLVRGRVSGDLERVPDWLEQAYFIAEATGHWPVVEQAATRLVTIVGHDLGRHNEGLTWAEHAQAALARHGREPDLALMEAMAGTHRSKGDLDAARALYERALDLPSDGTDADELARARARGYYGALLIDLGEYDAALTQLREAQQAIERRVGPGHPWVATTVSDIGGALGRSGDFEGALEHNRRAVEILLESDEPALEWLGVARFTMAQTLSMLGRHEEALAEGRTAVADLARSLPDDHPNLGTGTGFIGRELTELGRHPEALEEFERADEIYRRSLPPEHPLLIENLQRVVIVHLRQGRHDAALAPAQDVLERVIRAYGGEHPRVAVAESTVGRALAGVREPDYDEAARHMRRALEIEEKALGPDNPVIAVTHAGLADVLTSLGDYDAALAELDRALAIQRGATGNDNANVALFLSQRSATWAAARQVVSAIADAQEAVAIYATIEAPPEERGEARFQLGQLLWKTHQRREARTLVESACEDFRQGGTDQADRLAVAQAWLSGVQRRDLPEGRARYPGNGRASRR